MALRPAPMPRAKRIWCGRLRRKLSNSRARRSSESFGMKSFALALGSGGARGLAHIAVIEALDERGVKPTAIAGTSLGDVVGAAYAAGRRGRHLRHHVLRLAHYRRE